MVVDLSAVDSCIKKHLKRGGGACAVSIRSIARSIGIPKGNGFSKGYRQIAEHIREAWDGEFFTLGHACNSSMRRNVPENSSSAVYSIQGEVSD